MSRGNIVLAKLQAEIERLTADFRAVAGALHEAQNERDRLQHFQTSALVSIGALQIENSRLRAALEAIALDERRPDCCICVKIHNEIASKALARSDSQQRSDISDGKA